jgi:hypothetical protein
MVGAVASTGILAELFLELNRCESLFLRGLNEPRENSLRVVVEEGKPSPEETSIEIAGTVISGVHRVLTGEHTSLFEISWDHYMAYSVINESYAVGDESEKFELGNLVRVYSESKFLDFVRRATWTQNDSGFSQHIEIVCECHILDVISTTVPTVKKLRSARLG